ncbi:hypothetical protein HDU86_004120 [Geranomyces michiganensis]|nr:hypothetical protein HDU86_004120 [Geranomyces michiganensis]
MAAPLSTLSSSSPSASRRLPVKRSKSHQRLRLDAVRAASCSRARLAHTAPTRSPLLSPPPAAPTPTPSNTPPRHYLFGYGSLINPQSRLRTVPVPTRAIPATVKGLQRSWSYPCPRNQYTAVGVTRVNNGCSAQCNGVLIPLSETDPEADLRSLDARETHYTRTLLPVDDIVLDDDAAFNRQSAIVWVYELAPATTTTRTTTTTALAAAAVAGPPLQLATATIECLHHTPTPTIPIPQSYVDVVLEGCLEYGPAFAADFVLHTKGWEGVWVNDRHADISVRRYVRNTAVGEAADPAAPALLDGILRALVPAAFGGRVEL